MKFVVLILSLATIKSFAAVNAGMVWEFRSTATANMANSGGYDSTVVSPGTDYTLQDGSQFSGSNLVTANGTTNPCKVTSVTHNFVSTDNGNTIRIVSGGTFTAGIYEIISTSANAATLDRACASGASTSAGVWVEGGALNFGSATLDTAFFTSPQPGNVVWIKNGSYSTGSAIAAGTAGGTNNPIMIKGYNLTRGDSPMGSTRPTINTGANIWTFATNWDVYNIMFTGTSDPVVIAGTSAKVISSKFTNTSTTAGRTAMTEQGNGFVLNSEFISYRGIGIKSAVALSAFGNYFHDSDIGISSASTANPQTYVNNIFSDNVSNAVKFTGASQTGNIFIMGNTFYGAENKLGVGLTLPSGSVSDRVMNNIFYGFTTGVSNAESGQAISYDDYNDYFNNTTDNTNWPKGSNDKAVNPAFGNLAQVTGSNASTSSSTLTDASANFSNVTDSVDFLTIISGGPVAGKYLITSHTSTTVTVDSSLGTTASGVVYQVTTGHNFAISYSLKALGYPNSFPAGLTNSYTDIGAVQRREGSPGIGVRR